MTEQQEGTSEAFERLKTDTSEIADTTVSAAQESLSELQESLKRLEELIGDAADKYARCVQNIREHPVAGLTQSAGVGLLVGWLCGEKREGHNKETEMGHGAETETIRILQKKIRALQDDLARLTSSAAEELQSMASKLKDKYDATSEAAMSYIDKNPGKTSLAAGTLGFAAGFLLHLMLKRHEGTT
ncbi:MAG TPA: hypothetical protein VM186_10585 [Planctomycetota bacterium]|nr:hypothetical protein [Planctomycetota bacterium]